MATRFDDLTQRQTDEQAVSAPVRNDWTREEIAFLFDLPFPELIFRAASVHREFKDTDRVQLSTLLSIKTGG